MIREAKLMKMKGAELIQIADNYGIKIGTSKDRKQLKESKKSVVEKILKHEELMAQETAVEEMVEAVEEKPEKKVSKRSKNLIEFNGKSQTLAEWSEELGIPVTTLYGRLYQRNYTVEEAFTSTRTAKGKKTYEYNGKTQTLAEWSAELGISTSTLYGRIHYRNCTIEEAFTMKKKEAEEN